MKPKKINILSAEEMKKQVVGQANTEKIDNCAITHDCPDGESLGCSGSECIELYDDSILFPQFIGLKCIDFRGDVVYDKRCKSSSGSDSGTDSGSGITKVQYDACSGLAVDVQCEWRDDNDIRHPGICKMDMSLPYPDGKNLYCREYGTK